MMSLWSGGLYVLRFVLGVLDLFLTPDLRENGPGAVMYQTTFWFASVLVLFMAMIQFGTAAVRRDGASLARVAIGTAQFVMVWVTWVTLAVAVVAAASGLTKAIMRTTMGVDAWSQWDPWESVQVEDITDTGVAVVLGVMGIFLIFAAIGHLLIMLTRAGALLVLVATGPIAAAGLVSDVGRSWFWKSLRWLLAAAFTPVVIALVMGAGIQMTTGVVQASADGVAKTIGTIVPGVVLVLIGCFAPLALFKLLAFVDPGTSSGAAMRSGLAAQGGMQGLMSPGGGPSQGGGAGGAASQSGSSGRSGGEDSSESATAGRFGAAMAMLGPVGQAASTGLGAVSALGTKGAAIGADLTNQMGVGSNNYIPDFGSGKGQAKQGTKDNDNPDVNGSGDQNSGTQPAAAPRPTPPPRPRPSRPSPEPLPRCPAPAAGVVAAGGCRPPAPRPAVEVLPVGARPLVVAARPLVLAALPVPRPPYPSSPSEPSQPPPTALIQHMH